MTYLTFFLIIFFSATCGQVFSTRATSHADKPLTSSGDYPFKTTITWTCVTGTRLEGHKTTRCLESGWTNPIPLCWYGKELNKVVLGLMTNHLPIYSFTNLFIYQSIRLMLINFASLIANGIKYFRNAFS